MATLQKLREKGPLLAIIIGLALLAFILGDAFTSGKILFKSEQLEIAEVSGKSISYTEYQSRVDDLIQFYQVRMGGQPLDAASTEMVRNQTWSMMIKEYVLQEEIKELGIAVSPEEMFALIQGNNPDPLVVQTFSNPQTGEFNPSIVIQFLKSLEQAAPADRQYWLHIENEILQRRLDKKYTNLIGKGLYVTTEETKADYAERNRKVSINYVGLSYNDVPDAEIKITDQDLKAYYKAHEDDYEQKEESRDVVYVTFDVIASKQDTSDILKELDEIKPLFAATADNEQFVKANSEGNYDPTHYKKEDLSPIIDSIVFNAEKNFVFGPYIENGSFKLSKLIESVVRADTVHARHILIQPNQTITIERAQLIADSLKAILLKDTAQFGAMVIQYSADQGSKPKGGDVGWFAEGRMVKEFSDACFNGKKGDIVTVKTQFGVHVIQIVEKGPDVKKVQVATIEKVISPSKTTRDYIYANTSSFAGNNRTGQKFDMAAQKLGLQKRLANNLRELDNNIPGLESPRQLVRWAFKAKKDEVSPVYELGSRFVVGVLIEIREKGIQPFEQVKEQVKVLVTKEKKAEYLMKKMGEASNGTQDISSVAQKLNKQVEQAPDVIFAMPTVAGTAGNEPAIVATASVLQPGKLSAPIKGLNGVYVISVNSVVEPQANVDLVSEKLTLLRNIRSRAGYQAYEALNELSKVVDKRAKFQ